MQSNISRFFSIAMLIALFGVTPLKVSRGAASPLLVRSVGMLDVDGTALYSVVLATDVDPLGKLTITATAPDKTQVVEIVKAPAGITGKIDGNAVTWDVPKLDANVLIGPFTYRVKLADKAADAPANASVKVSWTLPTAGSVEAAIAAGNLDPLAEVGKITIDAKGTVNADGKPDAVAVGDTGILVYVPADAVAQPTTLSFTRVKLDDKTVPSDVKDTWWCALISVTSVPAAAFTKSIVLVLPTRRTVTPGLEADIFIQHGDGQWQHADKSILAKATQDKAVSGFAFVGPNGNQVGIIANMAAIQGTKTQFGVGIKQTNVQAGTINSTTLSPNQIKDGTGNTLQSYVEQDNIIAILIGLR